MPLDKKQSPDPASPQAPAVRSQDPVDLHVGKQVRALRRARGVSSFDLADAMKITRQQLQKYESGLDRLRASQLYQVAKALQMPVSAFYEGLPDPLGEAFNEAVQLASRDLIEFLAEPEGRDLAIYLPKLGRAERAQIAALVRAIANDPDCVGDVDPDVQAGAPKAPGASPGSADRQ